MIESLVQAVRGAAFAIPGAFGAQEAGLILLCGMFEIPPDQALALSLIKRAADLVVGVPGLVSLQVLEGGRLKARYSQAKESAPQSSLACRERDACLSPGVTRGHVYLKGASTAGFSGHLCDMPTLKARAGEFVL